MLFYLNSTEALESDNRKKRELCIWKFWLKGESGKQQQQTRMDHSITFQETRSMLVNKMFKNKFSTF